MNSSKLWLAVPKNLLTPAIRELERLSLLRRLKHIKNKLMEISTSMLKRMWGIADVVLLSFKSVEAVNTRKQRVYCALELRPMPVDGAVCEGHKPTIVTFKLHISPRASLLWMFKKWNWIEMCWQGK